VSGEHDAEAIAPFAAFGDKQVAHRIGLDLIGDFFNFGAHNFANFAFVSRYGDRVGEFFKQFDLRISYF
jgi:hypothetical protein